MVSVGVTCRCCCFRPQSKYGKHCGRIVRLLLEKKQLEEKHVRAWVVSLLWCWLQCVLLYKPVASGLSFCDVGPPMCFGCVACALVACGLCVQVGELLMIPGKEVRGHLYKLLQARVLHLQV